jgi:two-component system LytT family response regulator
VKLSAGKMHVISKRLGALEKELDELIFIRIHDSHIVNKREVVQYENGRSGYVKMTDGANVPVSVRKKAAFLKKWCK